MVQREAVMDYMNGCRFNPVLFSKTFKMSDTLRAGSTLSPKQVELLDAVKRGDKHIICLWSRQTGKSTTFAQIIVWWLMMGKKERVLVLAPTEGQAEEMYDKVAYLLMSTPIFKSYLKKINSEKIIAYNGNRVEFLSASPTSHIRGKTATRLVLDETQDITDEKYYSDILPFVTSMQHREFTIIEAGTPQTKNHFYNILTAKGVTIIKQVWTECPFINKDFVLNQKTTMPEMLWRQEFLCDFIEEGYTCFPEKWFVSKQIENGVCLNPNNNREDAGLLNVDILEDYNYYDNIEDVQINELEIKATVKTGATYVLGFDPGRQVDNAAIEIWRVDQFPIKVAFMKNYPLGTTIPQLMHDIKILRDTFEISEFNIDWTNEKGMKDSLKSIGIVLEDTKNAFNKFANKFKKPEDRKSGLIIFTMKTKTQMVSNMQALIQKGLIRLPKRHEILYQQFLQQQYEVVANGYRYYHPSNAHDDLLWACLLACKNVAFEKTDIQEIEFANIWKKHNKKVGYEKGYKDLVITSNKFNKNKLGKLKRGFGIK